VIRDPKSFNSFLKNVREFVRNKAMPCENEIELSDEIPHSLLNQLREDGYFGWSIPEEFGGAGLTTEELVLGALELSQAAVAVRARVGTNTGIGSEGIVVDGTSDQKQRYLPKLASGEWTSCLAVTEPDAGSEASNIKTTARRDGEDYILNGEKCYITNAPIADIFTIIARTDPNSKGSKGVSSFIVERSMFGLSTGKPYRKMGQAGSPVSDIRLIDCRVPAANLLGGVEGKGFSTVMKALNKQRIHLAALSTGPAIRMLQMAIDHAKTRIQFGRPIADYQLIQAMIADCQTEIYAAKSMIIETACKRDRGEDVVLEASMCKYFATEICGRVADRCVQIFGGAGFVADHSSIERWYRDIRLFRLYEGTSQIHQLNIAKQILAASS
jgi:acyl-CoA dehydrogenase